MTSPSLAGYLAAGPHAAAAADRDDLYLDASGNLVVRLANGAALTIGPAGALALPVGVAGASADVVAALQGAIGEQAVNGGLEILQRGAGPYTANLAYAHDRWQILLGGTSTISVTDETTIVDAGSGHSLKAVYVQGSANSQVDQKLEHALQLRGRQVTVRGRVRGGVVGSGRLYVDDSGVKVYGAANAGTGAYETLAVTAPIGAAATAVRVGLDLGASDTVYLDNLSVAVGAVPRVYVPIDPALELLRCQRYYERIGFYANFGFSFYSAVNAGFRFPVLFRASKPVTPTITRAGTFSPTAGTETSTHTEIGLEGFTVIVNPGSATGARYGYLANDALAGYVAEANP